MGPESGERARPVVTCTAPGKLMLLGEYAVLHGTPALVTTVERRIIWRAWPRSGSWRLLSKGPKHHGTADFTIAAGRVHAGAPPNAEAITASPLTPFLRGLMQAAASELGTPAGAWTLELDTSAFFTPSGEKLGLGSSGALAASLFTLWAHLAGQEPGEDALVQAALRAHRHAQGGRGSGADVAASVCGGSWEIRVQAHGLERARCALPADMQIVPIWAGTAASTEALVKDVEAFAERAPDTQQTIFKAMDAASRAGLNALAERDTPALIAAFEDYGRLFERLSQASGAHVMTPALQSIAAAVRHAGAVFKPSGAGGGDFALAVMQGDSAARAALIARLEAAGLTVMPLTLEAAPCRVTPLRQPS